MGEALKTNKFLKKINLYGNDFKDFALRKISVAFKEYANIGLEEFNLGNNPNITDDGGVAFANSLSKNFRLTKLNLSDNNLKDPTAEALNKILIDNTKLVQVDLSNNKIHLKHLEVLQNNC